MNDSFHGSSSNNVVRIAITGVLAILALFLLAETIAVAQGLAHPTTAAANTITVSGTGQASVAPDIAHITFTVMQSAAAVADAQTAATSQANTAITYVEGQGIDANDVTTLSYDVSPQYGDSSACPPGLLCPRKGTNTVTGYQVSETVQVTVRDLTKVSALLQGLGQQNVEDITGPDFGLADPNEGDDAARAKAIANAEQEAQILAGQLGVHLGRITSFNENGGGVPYPMTYGVANSASVAPEAPNIPTGTNTYTSNVSITYEID